MPDSLFLDSGRSIHADSGEWYRIIRTLGSGGNAVTFLAVCTSGANAGVLFALKFFRRLSRPERRSAFHREIEFLKSRSHPSVMRVFDQGVFMFTVSGVKGDYPFVVAEYLGTTLRHVIRARPSSFALRVAFSVQLVSALVYLEKSTPQIIHRDIKPENIFIKGSSCVLGDFGLMKALDGAEEQDRDVLKESIGAGMPFFYRTPELVKYATVGGGLTTRTDVFQLGLVLTELFTGRNPSRPPANNDIYSPVELEPLGHCPGEFGAAVAGLLRRMLDRTKGDGLLASEVMDGFMGLFASVCQTSTEVREPTL